MTEFPLRMPLAGLSENVAFDAQEPATTRDARNMRPIDPLTGRIRMAQRSGMSRYNETQLSGSKVADLARVVFDNRNLSYSEVASNSANVLWEKVSESKGDTTAVSSDRDGNVYIVDGDAAVSKYSSDGSLVFNFAVPVKESSHKIRTIFVDDVFCIYVAVSEGAEQETARMWKYRQLPDNETEIVWELEVGAYTPRVKVFGDKLYAIQNHDDVRAAFIRTYEALDASQPILTQEIRAAWPLVGFDRKSDGSIVFSVKEAGLGGLTPGVGAPFDFARLSDPRYPAATQSIVDFSPRDLEDYNRRIWSWYRAEDIRETDVSSGALEDFPTIRFWRDSSGNGRHLFEDPAGMIDMPTYVRDARLGFPGVRIIGGGGLVSLILESTNKAYRDQQRTVFPYYTDSMFVAFFIARPVEASSTATFYSSSIHDLFINRDGSTALADDFDVSMTTNQDGADPGDGASGNPLGLDDAFNNDHQMFLLTFLCDGGVDSGNPGTGFTRSLLRINGLPIDRWTNQANVISLNTRDGIGANDADLSMEIYEIIVLDRRNPDVTTSLDDDEVIEHEKFGSNDGNDATPAAQSINELTKIEGYLMHKYGVPILAPEPTDTTYGHPFGVEIALGPGFTGILGLTGPPPDGQSSAYVPFNTQYPFVGKFSPTGDLVWTISSTDQESGGSSDHLSSLGHDVIVNSEGDIYTIGIRNPDSGTTGFNQTPGVQKLIDQGATVSADPADGAWTAFPTIPNNTDPDTHLRLAVDKFDNVYVPTENGVDGFDVDGNTILNYTVSGSLDGQAIAVDPRIPDYDGDLTTERAENIYLVTVNGGTAENETVYKLQLVDSTQSTGSTRTSQVLAVSGGTISVVPNSGSPTTPTGGSGALDSTAQYIHSVTHFSKVYFTDGGGPIKVYDPRENTVTDLESESAGEAPKKIRIIESWRGRLVTCRGVGLIDEAFNWKMSAIDDPTNWDLFPPVRLSSQAIAGINAIGPGQVPDIVNGFVPYNDDLAYFLCDHSIWMLNGDPMDGGQIDLVSDITGGAFGRAWAKDPEGNLFFFGSRGGLYVMRPGRIPERVSLHNIERRLQEIDLASSYMRLEWNYRDEGLHIIQCPFGAGNTQLLHYFWNSKTSSMWEDTFGSISDTTVQPTSVLVIDGDDVDDRVVLFGCEDSRVRRWDGDAFDDDSVAIDAYFTAGPLAGPDPINESRFVGPHAILANDQNGCRYEMFAVTEPDDLNAIIRSGNLIPGVNPKHRDRVRGLYCYLRLRNSSMNQRFAVETVTMDGYAAGRKRARGPIN